MSGSEIAGVIILGGFLFVLLGLPFLAIVFSFINSLREEWIDTSVRIRKAKRKDHEERA